MFCFLSDKTKLSSGWLHEGIVMKNAFEEYM